MALKAGISGSVPFPGSCDTGTQPWRTTWNQLGESGVRSGLCKQGEQLCAAWVGGQHGPGETRIWSGHVRERPSHQIRPLRDEAERPSL